MVDSKKGGFVAGKVRHHDSYNECWVSLGEDAAGAHDEPVVHVVIHLHINKHVITLLAINLCTDTSPDLWSFPLLGLDLVTEGAGVGHAGEAAAVM